MNVCNALVGRGANVFIELSLESPLCCRVLNLDHILLQWFTGNAEINVLCESYGKKSTLWKKTTTIGASSRVITHWAPNKERTVHEIRSTIQVDKATRTNTWHHECVVVRGDLYSWWYRMVWKNRPHRQWAIFGAIGGVGVFRAYLWCSLKDLAPANNWDIMFTLNTASLSVVDFSAFETQAYILSLSYVGIQQFDNVQENFENTSSALLGGSGRQAYPLCI